MRTHTDTFFVDEIDELREQTALGSMISFTTSESQWVAKKRVTGIVTAKYPNIFLLKDCHGTEKSYSWKDYLIGRFI